MEPFKPFSGQVYIGSILLERNRWRPGKIPTVRVSEWIDRFVDAGLDGVELWENHALGWDEEERSALAESALPIAIFNTYVGFDHAEDEPRRQAAAAANALSAQGVKYNFQGPWERRETQVRHLRSWAESLPRDARVLCECHPGTFMEIPDQAAAVFDALPEPRFQAMIHPFHEEESVLRSFFRRLGARITHAHVQLRVDGRFASLDEAPALVEDRIHLLRDEGFTGSFTLEFTAGTNAAGETPEALFEAALRDLAFLKERW